MRKIPGRHIFMVPHPAKNTSASLERILDALGTSSVRPIFRKVFNVEQISNIVLVLWLREATT